MTGSKLHICIDCGWYYDPKKGVPMGGIPEGTQFEKVPEGWNCPICHVGKDRFKTAGEEEM